MDARLHRYYKLVNYFSTSSSQQRELMNKFCIDYNLEYHKRGDKYFLVNLLNNYIEALNDYSFLAKDFIQDGDIHYELIKIIEYFIIYNYDRKLSFDSFFDAIEFKLVKRLSLVLKKDININPAWVDIEEEVVLSLLSY